MCDRYTFFEDSFSILYLDSWKNFRKTGGVARVESSNNLNSESAPRKIRRCKPSVGTAGR